MLKKGLKIGLPITVIGAILSLFDFLFRPETVKERSIIFVYSFIIVVIYGIVLLGLHCADLKRAVNKANRQIKRCEDKLASADKRLEEKSRIETQLSSTTIDLENSKKRVRRLNRKNALLEEKNAALESKFRILVTFIRTDLSKHPSMERLYHKALTLQSINMLDQIGTEIKLLEDTNEEIF